MIRDPRSGSFLQNASLATLLSFSGLCFAGFVLSTVAVVLSLKRILEFAPAVSIFLSVIATTSALVSLTAMRLWKTRVFDPLVELDVLIRSDLAWNLSVRTEISGIAEISSLQRSFNDLLEKIQKSNEIKAEFLSTVSHELRTPLTAIHGYVKLLAAEEVGQINETQKEFLDIVGINVKRLGKLIDDILDVEKMESGKFEVAREPQSLVGILKECQSTFGAMVREKGLRLEFKGLENDRMVLGERDRLVQIFANLLSNAIKYTSKGSVAVTLSVDGSMAIISVQDTGPGMTAEQRLDLFHKFRRLQNVETKSEGGTGLGLVIAQGLVEAHGGSIEVRSEQERGSEFIVRLPLFAQSISAESDVQRKRVLLLEQQKNLAMLIRRALELQNLTVDWVDSVAAMGTRIEQQNHTYDLVILDGIEPLKLLRKNPQGLSIPVCILLEENMDLSEPVSEDNERILFLQKYQGLDRLVDQVVHFIQSR